MTNKKDLYRLSKIRATCENNYFPVYFDFYDPGFQVKILDIMKNYDVPYLFFGGNDQAERKILCIYPDYWQSDELEWPVCSLVFKKNTPMNHRHVLGTLMSLGITRDLIGDIDIGESWGQVIIHQRIKDYLLIHFRQINNCPIECMAKEKDEILSLKRQDKELTLVVSSDRIDGMLGKIWGHSRQKSLDLIRQKKVSVNYEKILKNDYRIKNDDIIAVGGKGKARVINMDGRTKKGKIQALIKLYQ